MVPPERAAERAARESYGRLVAMLAARSRDLAASEDALSDAFVSALEQWPRTGVPDRPDAWLLTAARRRMIDRVRRGASARDALPVLELMADEQLEGESGGRGAIPDHRLALMFVCAHPAIDEELRTPLMLQTVLGLDAARIGAALLVAPKTMGQRLWRAKTKIRDAGVPFEIPERSELAPRLGAVLEAIYAAFGSGWEDVTAESPRGRGLSEEAIWLGRVLVELLPEEPEARGLLALMLFAEARRPARRDGERFVPLRDQDSARWVWPQIEEAEEQLGIAARARSIGPYQIEAAIQSAHASAARTGETDHRAIAVLYEALVTLAPTLGARVARAVALAPLHGGLRALAELDRIEGARSYQPYWAARASLLAGTDQRREAIEAYERAAGLSDDPAIRAHLLERARSVLL